VNRPVRAVLQKKMFDRNHNSNENHGAELVSYIYGELDERSRNAFESHLSECVECAMELSAFADARLGLIEWRRADFDHLATPELVIREAAPIRTVAEPKKVGFFAGLTEAIFSLPLFAKTGVALASVAILAGLIYFVTNSRNERSATGGGTPPSVTAQPDQEPFKPAVAPNDRDKEVAKTGVDAKVDVNGNSRVITGTPAMNKRPTRILATNHKINRGSLQLATNAVNSNKMRKGLTKAPRLNTFDEDEDKTLRLADLFAEIGKDGF